MKQCSDIYIYYIHICIYVHMHIVSYVYIYIDMHKYMLYQCIMYVQYIYMAVSQNCVWNVPRCSGVPDVWNEGAS